MGQFAGWPTWLNSAESAILDIGLLDKIGF